MSGSGRIAARAWATLMLLVAVAAPMRVSAQISASIDRTAISLDDTVTVTVTLDGSMGRGSVGQPEGEDFTTVGTSTFQSMQIVNGRRSVSSSVALTLRPVRAGALEIGRIAVQTTQGTQYTAPIRVDVAAGAVAAPVPSVSTTPVVPTRQNEAGDDARPSANRAPPSPFDGHAYRAPVPALPAGEPFLMAFSTEAAPTRGQQIVVDYVLFVPTTAWNIEPRELSEPSFVGAWFQDVTDTRKRTTRLARQQVGATTYEPQLVRSYVVVPTRAGDFEIAPMSLDLEVVSLGGRPQRRLLTTTPLLLAVAEPPIEGRPSGFVAGNVGDVKLSVDTDLKQARVGDTITLTIEATGYALASSLRLPDVPQLDAARVFAPRDRAAFQPSNATWVEATATRAVALVPRVEGPLTIPSLELVVYDPWAGAYVTRRSDSITITVAGVNPNAADPTRDEAPVEPAGPSWLDALPAPREVRAASGAVPVWAPGFGYAGAAAAPVLAWLALLGAGDWQRRRAASAGDRRRADALPRAVRAMAGDGAGAAAAALRGYVEDATGAPTAGLTAAQLRARAEQVMHADAAATLAALVRRGEEARYGGEGGDGVAAEARALLAALDRSTP